MAGSDSDEDIFGAAAMFGSSDDEGAVEVDVQRKDSGDVDRSGHENWVFKEKGYWDERFGTEKEYDWLTGFAGIEGLVRKHISPTDRVLVVGCGNSTLSRDMYEGGFVHLTNLDFSAVVIDAMSKQHGDCPTMTWVVGDMMNMTAMADGSFDVVLDKAAMDALLVDEGDVWNPRDTCLRDADRALSEFSRVLRPGGKLVQVTFAQPHFRKKYLDKAKYEWNILPHESISEGLGYFFYTCVKGGQCHKTSGPTEPPQVAAVEEAVSQVAASEMPASLSYSEVRGHNQASDCWLIISGTVYDLTQFADDHPGGAELIHQYAGRDATSAFLDAHSLAVINAMLPDRAKKETKGKISGPLPPEAFERQGTAGMEWPISLACAGVLAAACAAVGMAAVRSRSTP